jgi:hypothetical protein
MITASWTTYGRGRLLGHRTLDHVLSAAATAVQPAIWLGLAGLFGSGVLLHPGGRG